MGARTMWPQPIVNVNIEEALESVLSSWKMLLSFVCNNSYVELFRSDSWPYTMPILKLIIITFQNFIDPLIYNEMN